MKLLKILLFGLLVILISKFVYSQGWYAITITNTQSQATPQPFQQDIAICNGDINIGNNFAYVNNPTLFNEIDSNGQNVYFSTTAGGSPNIYSWYEGQLNYGNTYCDVWWINLPQGINANSEITIFMYIGSSSDNYYSQYYPYVGAPIQVLSTSQYDNGQDVFNYYQNFGGLSSLPSSWTPVYREEYSVSFSTDYIIIPSSTWGGGNEGITTTVNFNIQNNILEIYASIPTTSGTSWDIIALGVGEANSMCEYFIGCGGGLIAAGNNDGAAFTYPNSGNSGQFGLVVGTNGVGSTTYNYAPTIYEIGFSSSYTYFLVNYTQILSTTIIPGSFSLPITIGQQSSGNNIYLYWVLLRSLPPNDVMPSISIQPAVSVSSVQLNPSSSSTVCPGTQTSSTVTANLNNPSSASTTVTFSCSAPSGITCSLNPSSCTTSGSSCSTTLYVNSSPTMPPGSYSVTVTASISGSSASATYTYNIGQQISISSQQSSNFQNSYNIYITGCAQNYTLYVNNSPYCYDSYSQFQNINSLCIVSYSGSYSVYAQGCYNGNCVNSNTVNLNIPSSGITVPIIDINILNITNQNINTTISVNGSNQNIQSINVYYNNNNVYSNSNVNTNYYSFNLQLPYSNNGNITVCSTLTNGQSNCVTEIFNLNVAQTYIYYGIIQLKAYVQPININTTYGPIGNNLEFSLDYPEYILTLNITNIGNMTLNNITINLLQLGNVPEILYNQIPIQSLNNININQLQPNQSYILQFNILPLYIGSSSLLLNFNVNGQNIGNAQYNLVVNGPTKNSSLIASENINYILILVGIIASIIFLI
ncbi:MAG: hypothetical protein RXQ68_02845 [Candidatus Nanopusillus sp.]